jgi:hypothetical protein
MRLGLERSAKPLPFREGARLRYPGASQTKTHRALQSQVSARLGAPLARTVLIGTFFNLFFIF